MQQPTSRPVTGASGPAVAVLGSTAEPPRRPVPVGYRDVLRVPCAARLLAGTLIGRLPNGMAPLAIVIGAHSSGAAISAALAALYLVASAVGGPLIGRLADRYGQTLPFSAATVLSTAALVGVAVGSQHAWWTVAGVTVAGAAKPPLEAGLRALFGTGPFMPSRAHQRTALSLEAAAQELIYVVGPLLVAGIVMVSSALAALVATAALGAVGTALVVTTPASRTWTTVRLHRSDWRGPLRSPQLRGLYLAMVGVGIPLGALTPLAVSAAAEYGTPWLSGALPAVLSLGAVAGGLLYGARLWPGTAVQHLIVLSSAFAGGWLLITLAASPTTALAGTVVPGLVMAPLLGVAFAVTGDLAPAGTATEAQALLVAALDVGCAAGAAAAGLAPTTGLLPAGAAGAALILVTARHRLSVTARRPPLPVS
ncbi:MFS transporter [Streptomyces turgidiscabies]|uniref:MFS transporter n=1 Tax=Streptomyces turgidiscabies TaxID=85558 RepID=UPI0038F6CBDD